MRRGAPNRLVVHWTRILPGVQGFGWGAMALGLDFFVVKKNNAT